MTGLHSSTTGDGSRESARLQKKWRPDRVHLFSDLYTNFDQYLVRLILLPTAVAWVSVTSGISIAYRLYPGDVPDVNTTPQLFLAGLIYILVLLLLAVWNLPLPFVTRLNKGVWECVWPLGVAVLIILSASTGAMLVRQAVIRDPGNVAFVALALFVFSAIVVFLLLVRNVSSSEYCKKLGSNFWSALRRAMPLLAVIAVAYFLWPTGQLLDEVIAQGRHVAKSVPLLFFVLPLAIAFLALLSLALLFELPRYFYAGLGGGLTIATVTFNLGSQLAVVFNVAGQLFGWNFNAGCTVVNDADPCATLKDTIDVLGVMLGVVSAGTITATASEKLSLAIDQIRINLGFSDRQRKAAIRLRHPAQEATPPGARLSQRYPQEIRIEHLSKKKRFPLESLGPSKGSRIKLIINPGSKKSQAEQKFNADWLHALSQSARIVFDKSIFFVCAEGEGRDVEVVSYGSAFELCELSELSTPFSANGERMDDAFYKALNLGDAAAIRAIINEARKHLLVQQPHRDLLLSTVTQKESEELGTVMEVLGQTGLSRVLLVSREGYERSIVGAAEISAYLVPPAHN